MRQKEFTKEIKSDYGTSHEYTVIQHPGEEGFAITQKMVKAISTVLPPIVDAVAGGGQLDLDSDLREVGISGEAVSKSLNSFASELVSLGGVSFAKEILKYTYRTNEAGQKQMVATHFNEIYQGNYYELIQAVAFSIKSNFGPSLRAALEDVNLSRMTALLRG